MPTYAQGVTVTATTGQKFVNPGAFLTVVFEIKNTGAVADTYDLNLALPAMWSVVSALSSISIASGDSEVVFITMFVPSITPAERFTVRLTAASQGFVGVSDSGDIDIDVRALGDIGILSPLGQRVFPGASSVTYVFTVENKGNIPDIFSFEVRSSRGFSLQVRPTQLGLLPGNSDTVEVTFEVPLQTTSGVDQLTFKVISTVSPEKEVQAIVLTQILPPTADGVLGSLFLSVPAQLSFRLNKDLVNNSDSLGLNFNTSGALGDVRLDIGTNINDLLNKVQIDSLSVGVQAVPDDGFSFNVSTTRTSKNISGTVRFPLGLVTARYFTSEATNFEIITPQTPTLQAEPARIISNVSISALAGTKNGLNLSGAMTLSDVFGTVGRSGHVDLSYRLEDFQAQAGFFLTGPNFSGSGLDREGFRASGGFSSPPYIVFPSFEFSNNNVDQNVQTTTHKTQGRIALGLALPELPAIRLDFSTEKTQTSSNNMGVVLNGPTRFIERRTLSISYVLGQNSISISQRHEEVHDELTGDIFVTEGTSLSARLGIFSPLVFTFSMDDAITKNIALTPLVVTDLTFNRTFGILVVGDLINTNLTLTFDDKRTLFSTLVSARLSNDLQLSLGFNMSFITLGPANPSKTLMLNVDNRFALPIPFAIKGRIEGTVYIDENNNGKLDSGDTPATGLVINVSGQRVSTDNKGFYRTPPLEPGTQNVAIEGLLPGLSPTIDVPFGPIVDAGQTLAINIPLKRVALISGLVFNDANRNGIQDQGEGGIPNVRVQLSGQGLIRQTSTNANGRLGFADLPPGDYRLVVDLSSLPPRFELTTPTEVNIAVVSGGGANALWGAAERPRQIVVTFRPPQAEFSFSPANPVAGQLVAFDGSSSEDPDGFIQLYEWDFDNDGKTDATGFEVEHIFAIAGAFEVKLTVTDNDGNEGSTIQTVTVAP